jgi:uncharacterized protein YceK
VWPERDSAAAAQRRQHQREVVLVQKRRQLHWLNRCKTTRPMHRFVIVIALVIGLAGCGTGSSLSTPTNPAPTPVPVAGIWTLTETRTSITGGECLDGALQGTVGTTAVDTMVFTQNGTSLSAVSTAQSNGVSCNWTGTAGTDRFVLNMSSCQSNVNLFGLRCSNGAMRDLRISSAAMTLSINANGTYTGTKAETYNVVPAGSSTQVGTMIFNENASMTK